MPRQPSEEEKEKYNVEALIERKVALMRLCDTEGDILRGDPEGSKKAREELEKLKGDVPSDPELTKKFLEKCEKIVEQPATTLLERHMKVGAAMTLSMQMARKEDEFPEHVMSFVIRESTSRMESLSKYTPTAGESRYMDRLREEQREREANIPAAALNLNPDAGIPIDEALAESLLNDADSIVQNTFVLRDPGEEEEDLEDVTKFRIIGWGRSIKGPSPYWEIVYDFDDYDFPTRIDREEIKDLLLNSTMYKD